MELFVRKRGQGEPLLMLHGIISDGSFFDDAAKELENDFTVIACDRRGYGRTALPDGCTDFTVASQAEDAARVLEEHAGQKAWIFGNSAGGLIGVELALRHPELVRGMVLLEPSLIFDDDSRALMEAWNGELNEYVRMKRIKQAMPAFARVISEGAPPRENTPSKSMTMAEMRMAYHNLENFMYGELNEVQTYFPPLERVRTIRMPVCVIVTEDGKNSMFARTSTAGAGHLGWPVRYIPGNHNAVKEESAAFAEALSRIIAAWREEEQA